MILFDFSFALGFATGGALIWFSKDWIMKMVIGGNAVAAKLHAKADAIKAAL
jgi:hypothetical protein